MLWTGEVWGGKKPHRIEYLPRKEGVCLIRNRGFVWGLIWGSWLAICFAVVMIPGLGIGNAALAEGAAYAADYQDGVYQDLAAGYGDEVIVTVTVQNGRIVSLDAKNRNGGESEYFWKARDGMAKAIIQAQTYEGVEAVTGATGTSGSILDAMKLMMEQLRYSGQSRFAGE